MSANSLPPKIKPPSTSLDNEPSNKRNRDDFWLGLCLGGAILIISLILMNIILSALPYDLHLPSDLATNYTIRDFLIYLPPIVLFGGTIIIALVKHRPSIVFGILALFGVFFACGLIAGVLLPVLCSNI